MREYLVIIRNIFVTSAFDHMAVPSSEPSR